MSKYRDNLFLGAECRLFEMAKILRRQETEAERLLWSRLCNKQLGVKFRRQHPLHDYVVDFYCYSHKLVIEIDGPVHETEEAYNNDNARSRALKQFNIEVIRFTNDEVLQSIKDVLEKIKYHLKHP